MCNQFGTELENVDGQPILVVTGEIDDATAPMLDDACRILATLTDRLVLDFADVTFMDSMGLRVLIDATRHKVSITVRNAPDRVIRLFHVTRLADQFLEPLPSSSLTG